MGKQQQKQLERLYSRPKDLKWSELERLLGGYGYKKLEGDGSRVKFFLESPRNLISLHKPHPDGLKEYQIKNVIENLERITDGND